MLAFSAVFLVWGSTYLAIEVAVGSIPPLLLMGIRSTLAGGALYAWSRLRGGERPASGQWRTSLLVGALFFLVGHGGLAWAETRVPSGVAALIFATMPIWVVVLGGREIGSPFQILSAMLLGMIGVLILVGPPALMGGQAVDPTGAFVLILAAFSWAVASVLARRVERAASTILATGMDLLAGGALLLLASLASGEPATLGREALTLPPVVSVLYLVLFGSILTLTAYNWLLRNTTLPRASSYVYVNPVVAIAAGWAFGGDALTPRVVAAAAVLILAVVLIMAAPPARPGARAQRDLEPVQSRT